ncbi:MAG: GH1 family beta-glucosidase [Egibacteraceae bacterium]
MSAQDFPDDFLWGAATASYQIEGGVDEGGRGPSIWDTFSHAPGNTLDGATGDIACDHFHRLEDDVALMAELGLRAYRFSVAWPRVQPGGNGSANTAGLDFYSRLVDALLERGIEPVPTLYHWDLPHPLQDAGGWPARQTAEQFSEYTGLVVRALGDRVRRWITLNEPQVASFQGYAAGTHAPGVTDDAQALAAAHHLLLGHGLATAAMRAEGAREVGITLNLATVTADRDREQDAQAAALVDALQNRLFLDGVRRGRYPDEVLGAFERTGARDVLREGDDTAPELDFMGINYYFGVRVQGGHEPVEGAWSWPGARELRFMPPEPPLTGMGWPQQPEGLERLLLRVTEEYGPLPLYVTENGAAFDDYVGHDGAVRDSRRVAYLDAHLRAAHRAIEQGADLRGYFAWSLLDNFEWALGYSKRFGLIYVDYATLERIPKSSFAWYRDVIARGGLGENA